METFHLIVLAIIQGVTEFLPISSSAHLILLPRFMGEPDQGLLFDVCAHLGSLSAMCLYFYKDISIIGRAWGRSVIGGVANAQAKLGWFVLIATVPVGLLGLFVRDTVSTEFRSPQIIAVATILFGLALWWSDACGRRTRALDSMKLGHAVLIGCAQALALIPGTSRSGVTMTAALALGLTRVAAARFSFLLSIPVIGLASALECWQLNTGIAPHLWMDLGLIVLFAGISTYVCVYAFLQFIEYVGMLPFVIYRVALGLLLLWYFA